MLFLSLVILKAKGQVLSFLFFDFLNAILIDAIFKKCFDNRGQNTNIGPELVQHFAIFPTI